MTRLPQLSLVLALLFLFTSSAPAAFESVWTIGTQDDRSDEFSVETFVRESAPGSPTARDDFYYFAGTYPLPIGTVVSNELPQNFERGLTSTDQRIQIHAVPPANQATAQARYRLTVFFIWSGSAAARETVHDIVFRMNGVAFSTNFNFRGDALLSAEINASEFNHQPGQPIVAEIERVGGSSDAWLGIDFLRLDVDPTANVDGDGDGFPKYWEESVGFSDTNPNDAVGDYDQDGLNGATEQALGTHPKLADTDGDGLLDGEETNSDPLRADSDDDGLTDSAEVRHPNYPTNPLLSDSDNDGAPDGWELHLGTNPTNATSIPPALNSVIGIQFVSAHPDMGFQALTPNLVAGVVPQIRWNSMYPLIPWGVGSFTPMRSGNNGDIKRPTAGSLVSLAGAATGATIDFRYNGCWSTANEGSPNQRLLNAYLQSRDADPAQLSVTNVPYTNYHVFVYVAADYVGPVATVRVNGDTNSDLMLRPFAVKPETGFRLAQPATTNRTYFGNYVAYTNLTSSDLSVAVFRTDAGSGLSGIQIVDAFADHDSDGLPDWWELQHGLNPGSPGDSGVDLDQDGLNNGIEFARGTDPNLADTDGDGLRDAVETGTGIYMNESDTGSDPLRADTDGDRLSDGAEVTALFASNPNVSDSDGDGVDDRAERESGSNPKDASIGRLPVPEINPSDGSLLWEIRHVQLRWNHDTPWEIEGGDTRQLLQLQVDNQTEPSSQALLMGVWARYNKVTPYFRLNNIGGFARSSSPTSHAWYADWNGVTDISSLLGFTGVGAYDFSDPLAFRIHAVPGATGNGDWTVSMTISNEASGVLAAQYGEESMIASASILNRTAVWQSHNEDVVGESDYRLGVGIDFYRSTNSVQDLPQFLAHKDSDNDGMPDAWETTYGLNPALASDAALDQEPDGLSNLQEYLHGANPTLADSDGDGYDDAVEVARFSNPGDSNSVPLVFANGISLSGDANGNGFPDVWEAQFNAAGLNPNDDTDGDGVQNWREAIYGTDPRSASVRFHGRISRLTNGQIEVRWPYLARKAVRFFGGSDFRNWTEIATPPALLNGEFVCTMTNTQSWSFFYSTLADLDSDGDGVSDWAEIRMGSRTNSANSLGRAVLYDSTGNGRGDSTLSGDYAAMLSRYGGAGGSSTGRVSRVDAVRLLMQGSFGPTRQSIARVRQMGVRGWIDDQISNRPATLHRDYIEEIFRDFDGPRTAMNYSFNEMSDFVNGENVQTAFARAATAAPDQLRQRVAFALSQILVISRQDGNLENRPRGLSSYYDIFVTNAFGNYFDVLQSVTFHPAMGRYLSHVGNQPPAPEISRFPDENYAREVMQLFSIGLWELNPDGTRKLDSRGEPIPTYSNAEITHLARVMTGFWFGGNPWGSGGWQDTDFAVPMEMHAEYHDFDRKVLLGGRIIPSRLPSAENAYADVNDALRMLFEHDNTPAFIGRGLIQFLVTDNPSTNYVRRIHDVFVNNGNGVRGDMAAVVRAILLDPEARDPAFAEQDPTYGRMREPVARAMHLARLTRVNQNGDMLWFNPDFYEHAFQAPLMAPTVFNFFRPDYQPPGALKTNSLVGPVFQITTSYSALSFPNLMWELSNRGFTHWRGYAFRPDFRDEIRLSHDVEALLDHVNLLCCGNRMSVGTRDIIRAALNAAQTPVDKARLSIYLALMSPEGAVQR